jgi:hypothetical protein
MLRMRNSRSAVFAAYLPFFRLRRADRPNFKTTSGLIPISFDALRSEIRPDLIFEMTCPTESQASWNCFDREKYCREVVGTLSRRILILRRSRTLVFTRILRSDFLEGCFCRELLVRLILNLRFLLLAILHTPSNGLWLYSASVKISMQFQANEFRPAQGNEGELDLAAKVGRY